MARARRRASSPQRWLVIMAKEPRLGGVKTRLAGEIGAVRALSFYRTAAANVVRRLARDRRWRTVLALAPDACVNSAFWPGGTLRLAQGHGGLGQRMQRVFDRLPPGPAVIVGTDVPQLVPAHVAAAFRLLGGHDAVLGPADDGGYWLVGLRRSPRVLRPFAGVRWSSPHALADTRANLRPASVALTRRLADVDGAREHRRLRPIAERLVLSPVRLRD